MKKRKRKYWLGIDLGGTKILTALLNHDHQVLATSKSKMETAKGEKYFLDVIRNGVEEVLDSEGVKLRQVAGLGMGCPGVLNAEKGVVISSPNIPFLKNYPLAGRLKKLFKIPVALENDVNTGLVGEHHFGAARGFSNVIGIFIGTGIGGALIFNGKLYRGSTGGAGEIGHMPVDPEGPVCGCGNRGCLEALAGRLALSSEAAALALRQQAPALFRLAGTDLGSIKSKVLAKAIKAGDSAIRQLVRRKARLVGRTMGSLVNVLNPEMIVLGGGVVEAMEKEWLKEAQDAMNNSAMPDLVKHVKVTAARLGDYAIVMGAAKIISDRVLKKDKD